MEKLCRGGRISPPPGTEEPQKGPVLIGLMLISIYLYMFSVVCAASDAVLWTVLVCKMCSYKPILQCLYTTVIY